MMVVRSYQCNESWLKSLLDDDLPEREAVLLNGHLETCKRCQRTLERLAAGSRIWAGLRELAPGHGTNLTGPTKATERYPTIAQDAPNDGRGHALEFLTPTDAPGSLGRLGPYEVTDLLGRGGFGIVVKAFDPTLGRAVAIKVLAPELATSAAARGRFAREARAAAAVVHDHVVAIHAVDSCNNLPYLVMPLVAGRSLQERVDRDGPLGVKEILRIGMQTACGLAAAHNQGLVHRDVKPSNILLENGVERVKLTDFGLARAVDDASLTQSGVVAGTPQYMSPEQARGEAVDHRSDLFSLGSVLYFMCTGHAPFRASSTPAVLRRVSDERPRRLGEINNDIPGWLEAIVERLHEKSPASRFQSATEVAETLGRYLSDLQRGVPITARPSRPAPSPRPWLKRKELIAAAVIVPALALLAATYGRGNALLAVMAAMTPPAAAEARRVSTTSGQDGEVTIIVSDDAKEQIIGSGVSSTKTWDLVGFDHVHVTSTFRAAIVKGTTFKVVTTGDDNVLPYVRVVKEGTTLHLSLASGSYRLKKPLAAEITLPALIGLDIGGASRGALTGFDSEPELTVKLSGSSGLQGKLSVEKGDFTVDGASTLQLVGSSRSARITGEGSSHLKLGEFLLKEGQVTLGGASTIEIALKSEKPFKAEVSGSSTLKGTIAVSQLELAVHGASQANLEGTATNAKLEASGSSTLRLTGLVIQTADVRLSGASNSTIDARVQLRYDVSSASSLKYLGDPSTLDGSTSSGSSISRGR
jgi:serine/threonine protein kinase